MQQKLVDEGEVRQDELRFLTHAVLMRDLRQWADSGTIPLVDAINALDQRRDVLVSWVHLSGEGNRLIAEALAAEIAERFCP